MAGNDVIIRFEDVSFEHGHNKPILHEVSFSVRTGAKITVMGQNGAGKSTLFSLLTGERTPDEGRVIVTRGASIAIARQVIPRDELPLTVKDFFERCFDKKVYDIEPRIQKVLDVVHLNAPLERIVKSFSGGQQARLLLAAALIQDPDILLLDEPTNNLDKAGIAHLTDFIKASPKTCIVISHDAEFLNSFTDGVLYLDVHTHVIEQYAGNYNDVLKDITARVERENRKNAQLAKTIQENKDKVNFFAQKGAKMRLVAKRMRDKIEEMEEEKVDVRREDKAIRPFVIPVQGDIASDVLTLSSVSIIIDHKPKQKSVHVALRKGKHLLLSGPNGIGKSTLLESIAHQTATGMTLQKDVHIGYYRQDFSTLNFDHTVYDELKAVLPREDEEKIRSTAASFLITGAMVYTKIGNLSEGQKGLVAFARLVLERPGLLILDEPTNHINFRHIPIIAKALDQYEGAMILVSHVPEFVKQIRIDETLELSK
jgi:ATPase subunit of ABC transporter with duplicated ATPase domains